MKKQKAITLISLVITIIILIILAGVAINLGLGENGIFRRAKQAKDKYLTAEEKERQQLNELYAQLNRGNEAENTKETEAGKRVKIPTNWVTISPNYVSTETGKVVKEMTVSSTVYAVSGGNGVTVPVPVGFYYVGGNIDTGIVISDEKLDGYETNGKDMASHEDSAKLVGNQFVWIPCELNNYEKEDFGVFNVNAWDRETNTSEYAQIKKYGGFYIGRYEAGVSTLVNQGTENEKFEDSVTFSDGINTYNLYDAVTIESTPTGYENSNYTARKNKTILQTGTNKAIGNIVIKANSIPYYHADYYTAVEMSRRLYSNKEHITSGLVTGTMWDAMLKYLRNKNVDLQNADWGNCNDTNLSELRGYYTIIHSMGNTTGFKKIPTTEGVTTSTLRNSNQILLTTAASKRCNKMNLYDIVGNLYEWTQETSFLANYSYGSINGSETYSIRGGAYSSTKQYAFRRLLFTASSTFTHAGFRVALYLE